MFLVVICEYLKVCWMMLSIPIINPAYFVEGSQGAQVFTDISGAGIPPDDVGDGPTKSRSWTKKKWISKK